MSAGNLFLSYHRPDQEAVQTLQKLLQARGVGTFLDREKLAAGLPWPQALEQGLRDAQAVAVFLGPHGLGLWQKREMGFALDRQVQEEQAGRAFPVIPVLLPGADISSGFLFLNTWIDLRRELTDPDGVEALANAAQGAGEARAEEFSVALCPYRGLRPFREEDGAFFFGREALVERMLDATLRQKLVVVVGPSGSGKTSAVQAGLVPLLRRQHPPAVTWDAVRFIPVDRPFHQLAAALIALLEPDASETDLLAEGQKLGDRMAAGELPLESVVTRLLSKSGGTDRLLVVADQFEDFFALTPESDRKAFLDMLLRAVDRSPVTVVVTLRASFYDHALAKSRELSDHLERGLVNLGPMTRAELQRTVVEPARRVGLSFESGLIERILDDVGDEPGNLSLLEFALTELWSRREGRQLTHAGYEASGQVAGAIAQRAEETFVRFDAQGQELARRVFTRLWAAASKEGSKDARQRAVVAELGAQFWSVIKALADARLLVTGRDAAGGHDTVEVAHDSLIRDWPRLRGWLEEDREFLLWRHRLRVELEKWQHSGHDKSILLRGAQLEEARRWQTARVDEITPVEVAFIRAGGELREQELVAQQRRGRRLLAVAAAAAIGFCVLAGLAAFQWRQADAERRLALSRELASYAISKLKIDPELSVLLAARAMEQARTTQAEDALRQSLLESHVRMVMTGHSNLLTGAAFSADGKQLVTASTDGTARVWDATTGRGIAELKGHGDSVNSAVFSPDGKRVATASADGTARVWDAATGQGIAAMKGHAGAVKVAVFSPDGTRLATASADDTARVWDAASGASIAEMKGHAGALNSAVFNADGRLLLTAGEDQMARVWDAATGASKVELGGHVGVVNSAVFSPDGGRVLSASGDGTARLWESDTGKPLAELRGHGFPVNSALFSSDGRWIVTTGHDNTARLWDAKTGADRAVLSGHADSVETAAFSPDGRLVVTASRDHSARVWDAMTGQSVSQLLGHVDAIKSAAFSPDGKSVVTASRDRTARIWEVAAQQDLSALRGHSGGVHTAEFSPDGRYLVTASADNTARIWDSATRQTLRELRGHQDSLVSAAFSPDGNSIVTTSRDGTARLWSTLTSSGIAVLEGHTGELRSAAFSPDGKFVVTASDDRTARVWEAGNGRGVAELVGHSDRVYRAAYSPDAKRIVTASADGTARIWEAATGKPVIELRGHAGAVRTASFSPDGKFVVTASRDETARVWEVATGKAVAELLGHSARVNSAAFSPDGTLVVTASWDNTAGVWEAATGKRIAELRGHSAEVGSAAFSPDGSLVVTSSWDATARIWETATGKALDQLRGHRGSLEMATFSPDGKRVVTAADDKTARLWEVQAGEQAQAPARNACDVCGPVESVLALTRSRVTRQLTPLELKQIPAAAVGR